MKKIFKKWYFWVGIVIILCLGMSGGEDTSIPTTQPIATITESITVETTLSERDVFMNSNKFNEDIMTALETLEDFTYDCSMEQSGDYAYLLTTDKDSYWVILYKDKSGVMKITSVTGTAYYPEYIPVETEPELSLSQKNAIHKAESYLKFMPFSRNGLIKQLEYEGFSNEDAVFAVDNIIVNWNEQAYLKAENYLNTFAFSKEGLIEQLEYEEFTDEQIAYAIEKIGY